MLKAFVTKRRIFIFILAVVTIFIIYLVIAGDEMVQYEKVEGVNILEDK